MPVDEADEADAAELLLWEQASSSPVVPAVATIAATRSLEAE